jgi:hypothetical protein
MAGPADVIAPLEQALRTPPAPPDSLARLVSGKNPFRASRSPAGVAFDPRAAAMLGSAPIPPAPARPPLSLAGLLLGDQPAALIEGLPGVEGARLMRLGERAGEYQVRSITNDRVVVAGRDTTWTLRLRTRHQ